MSNQELDRINAAVRDCLARCNSPETPLMSIQMYLGELKATGQWTDTELSLVRATVARFLRQFTGELNQNPPS